MSFFNTVALGALAGSTVFLTLPLGRIRSVSERGRSFLTMVALGVLLFVLVEVVAKGVEPVEEALTSAITGEAEEGGAESEGVLEAVFLLVLVLVGLAAGLLGIGAFESHFKKRVRQSEGAALRSVAIMIAVGLGLQNLTEGLVIGQAAALDQIGLAAVLILGFAFQNASEGFGIAGPLIGTRPSWSFLGIAGLIVAVPTFLGTTIGYSIHSEPLSVMFLALAAGAIMYELGDLYGVGLRDGMKALAMRGVFVGFIVAYGTELAFELSWLAGT